MSLCSRFMKSAALLATHDDSEPETLLNVNNQQRFGCSSLSDQFLPCAVAVDEVTAI